MSHQKLCPTCGQTNPPQEMLCSSCMADISSISPLSAPATSGSIQPRDPAPPPDSVPGVPSPVGIQVQDALKTVRDSGVRLKLRYGKLEFSLQDGEVIGRFEAGKEFLSPFPTVSRTHAKFNREASGWVVEDLGSTNGTFLNGQRIEPNRKHPVKSGDRIGFSSRVEVEILEG